MRRVLLVEPGYKNKYPPLGLMKISSYHKVRGDHVEFVKGCDPKRQAQSWDRIYVATLFTFHWKVSVDAIKYYAASVTSRLDIIVGGVMATLLGADLAQETGVTVLGGLLDRPGMLDRGDQRIVDHLIPDYSILKETDYQYGISDAYLGYATRGCPNRCPFCAVNRIEPDFAGYCPIKKQVKGIEAVYGPKKDLCLLDNNVLASPQFGQIVRDLLDLGFVRGARLGNKKRRLDFNQGLDGRLMTNDYAALLAETCIDPVRFAFDDIRSKAEYTETVLRANDHGLTDIATYVLYNYKDTPGDFYERIRTNAVINETYGTKISGFPMRFVPLTARTRGHVGEHWNRQVLRGVYCILLVTHGMVSPHLEFFEAAFGRDADEFNLIAAMPERYIIHRRIHERNGAADWCRLYRSLTSNEHAELAEVFAKGPIHEPHIKAASTLRLRELLAHYPEPRAPRD